MLAALANSESSTSIAQVFWAMLIVATGAAIVASQALISASYQIVSQVPRHASLNDALRDR